VYASWSSVIIGSGEKRRVVSLVDDQVGNCQRW
jgi:hypothetical protein